MPLTASQRTPAGTWTAGSFLAKLDEQEREALLRLGTERSFQRRATLLLQGDEHDRVIVLLWGRVKVSRLDQDGSELLLSIRDPGDLLGELAFIDGGARVATVSALEPVRALLVPGDGFRRYLETVPRVAVLLLETVALRFRESSVTRGRFAASDTMGRLSARLVELAERYGEPAERGLIVASPLSLEDLAAWTGASRAGVAQALRAMRECGWVQTERKELLVRDLAALRQRAS